MNTRLSQRVYSEAALEFWLQRLGGDWEQQFSEAELTEGRRLYRQGAVRQLELGDTDAIVHMRPDGAEEVYVVLDWQGKTLSVRASVEDQKQRRQLAVAGLYEVEELVGDEAAALAPEALPKSSVAGQAEPAADDSATDASLAAGAQSQSADAAGEVNSTSGNTAGKSRQTSGEGSADATRRNERADASAPSAKSGAQSGSTSSDSAGSNSTGSAGGGSTTVSTGSNSTALAYSASAGDGAASVSVPERKLELHFSLKQGSLLFRAGWRQRGRKRLLPALGETAPSAETMTTDEREMLIRLASLARRSGFRYDKGQGGYRLDNAERMEQFVGRELGGWSEFFDVTQETDVALLARGVQEVSLRARIGEGADGNLSLHWMAGFEQELPGSEHLPAFTSAERRRLLHSGATPLLLPGRGLVRLSEKQAKASERLNDAVSLFPNGTAPRYLLFSLTGLSDLPVEVSASLQRWRQSVLGGNLDPKPQSAAKVKGKGAAAARKSNTAAGQADVAGGDAGIAAVKSSEVGTVRVAVTATTVAPAATANAGADSATNAAKSATSGQMQPLPEFLRPYQRLGVGWMRHLFERGCHGLLADEMGLGKTVQVLSLIATAAAEQSDSAKSENAATSASTSLAGDLSLFDAVVSGDATASAKAVPALGDATTTAEVATASAKATASGEKPSLVVCPASVVPVWQAQAAQFFPHLKVRVLGAGCTFTSEVDERTDLWLASYTQLRRHKPLLEQVQFARAVLDEAQFIKNPEAKVTQACLSIKADHRLALSGTPLENRYLDVWTLFRFLMPGLLGTRRRFEEALATDEAKHLVTLRKQLAPFILRRTKNEVASELPEKVELDLYCPLSDMQRTEYRRLLTEGMALYAGADQKNAAQPQQTAMQRELTANSVDTADTSNDSEFEDSSDAGGVSGTESGLEIEHGSDSLAAASRSNRANASDGAGSAGAPDTADGGQPGLMSVLTLLTRLRQVSCDPALLPWMQEAGLHHSGKLNLLRDRLGEVFANGKKAVVFSQFVKFLDRAKQAIAADYPGVPVYQLIGTTRDRTRPVERFQAQEGAGVMLVSLKAGGTGITLHAADYVFLLDPWWNPAVEAQAVDRVHRIGQVNRVFVYRMVTAETVEARIAALKQTKRERFEQIMSGASSSDDFREAFRSLESLLGLLRESDAPVAAPVVVEGEESAAPVEDRPTPAKKARLATKGERRAEAAAAAEG